MRKCLVEVFNYRKNVSEWIQGEVVKEVQRIDLDVNGYNVRTLDGLYYEACHPICVKFI